MDGNIREYLRVIKRWWWLLVVSAVVPMLFSYLIASRQPELYEARVTLMVGTSLQSTNPDPMLMNTSSNLAAAYARLVRYDPITEAVIQRLNLTRSPQQLASQITTWIEREAQLLEIRVVDSNPQAAAVIANALAEELIAHTPSADPLQQAEAAFTQQQLDDLRSRIELVQEDIRELSASLVDLTSAADIRDAQERISSLREIESSYQTTYADLLRSYTGSSPNILRVFDAAVVPRTPVGRKTLLFVAIAGAAGAGLAIAAVLVVEYLDDSVRWSADKQILQGLPVLGTLPRIRMKRQPLAHTLRLRYSEAEAIGSLRTALQLRIGDLQPVAVLITSPDVGDGKTFTAVSLAVSLAATGARVVVVDGNLRSPCLHEWFDQPNVRGLSELLTGDAEVLDSWPPVELQPTGLENLYVLPAGRPQGDPAAVLSSGRLATLLELLKDYADILLIDSPAGSILPDPLLFLPVVDAVVVVCRHARTSSRLLRQLVRPLAEQWTHKPAGIAFNRVSDGYMSRYPARDHLAWENGMNEPEGFTVVEAAKMLGVSTSTIRRWCKTGRLKAERMRWRWIIEPAELQRFSATVLDIEEGKQVQIEEEPAALEEARAGREAKSQEAFVLIPTAAYSMPVEEIGLSKRALDHLKREGVESVGHVLELLADGDEGLLKLHGIGPRSLAKVKESLDQLDLSFSWS
jgi:capsular exopolysaccharide synthesis family protein